MNSIKELYGNLKNTIKLCCFYSKEKEEEEDLKWEYRSKTFSNKAFSALEKGDYRCDVTGILKEWNIHLSRDDVIYVPSVRAGGAA